MKARSSPGLGQWLIVTLIVASVVLLLLKIYQYGTFRQYLPAGLTVGGIDAGGLTRDQAADLITARYLQADVVIYHGEESVAISPLDAEFQLDMETMLNEADFQRDQQDFWAGFWGFLWNRPIEVEMVELRATHDEEALRRVLDTIAGGFDTPPQPPQPVPATMSFQYGESGLQTDIEASMDDVVAALYRPTEREAHLTLRPLQPERPEMELLGRLVFNYLQEQAFGGVASVFIMDLASGEEVRIDVGVPMSGMDLLKVPIALEAYRVIENRPTVLQQQFITQTLLSDEPAGAISLLNVIAGQENAYTGAQIVTESMWRLGLKNTFLAVPYGEALVPNARRTYETPANTTRPMLTNPDPAIQTTAEDMGTLLAMLYYCANNGGGALLAAYPESLTPEECQQVLSVMQENRIGSLIEEGVPPSTPIAHRHGWVGDTHADAGIVYSPGGDYVLVEFFYQDEWLPWDRSSPLMADISRAAYNFFNFDDPYLESTRAN